MDTSDTPSSVAGTATAIFYAFEALGPEEGRKDIVVVALNSWLGALEGWPDPKTDPVTLPDGTAANLDPASAHKRYTSLDPASCDILNVIVCPAKPGAQDTKIEIAGALRKNRTARVPWRFDEHTTTLVLDAVTIHESGRQHPTDRPSSWKGITAVPSVSKWSQNHQQELSRIVSGGQPIDCFRFNSETVGNEVGHRLDTPRVILRVRALSYSSSKRESLLMYEERCLSKTAASRSYNYLKKNSVQERYDKPHPDGSSYLERVGVGATWRVVEPVKTGTERNYHNIYYKINDNDGKITHGRLHGGYKSTAKILGTRLLDGISSPWREVAVTDSEGLTHNVIFSTSPEGLNTEDLRDETCPPIQLKGTLPWSLGTQCLVLDLCESTGTLDGSQIPDSGLA